MHVEFKFVASQHSLRVKRQAWMGRRAKTRIQNHKAGALDESSLTLAFIIN